MTSNNSVSNVRKDLLDVKFIHRSNVANKGRCCWSGVTLPDCKYCQNPYLKEKDEFGRDLMHSHDCNKPAEYACTQAEKGGHFFACGGMTELPQGFCKEHAIIHARNPHKQFSQRLDQIVWFFAVVHD